MRISKKDLMRWIGVVLLGILSFLLYDMSAELDSLGTNVDGDGIGVFFLGFEVNDRVPEQDIPKYAGKFIIQSALAFIAAIGLLIYSIHKYKNKNSSQIDKN